MHNRLLKFINKYQLLNKHQSGLCNKHSTFMALIILTETFVNAIDNSECAVDIFLDFQKAFDTVDYDSSGQIVFLWYPWSGVWLVFYLFTQSPTIS